MAFKRVQCSFDATRGNAMAICNTCTWYSLGSTRPASQVQSSNEYCFVVLLSAREPALKMKHCIRSWNLPHKAARIANSIIHLTLGWFSKIDARITAVPQQRVSFSSSADDDDTSETVQFSRLLVRLLGDL
ncbi:uncharacterized protein MEPE_04266 [Melanopsichium pennsylvanicum]|uniref:Uncharacterized protein n=1 Tax=Melanopsichium pennsylvanicum TaxID=63383 RepID=A0AAJ4XPK7_9BASI|nr:uncharacterized protein MEPE_04266 [Melanopsichium pennsylvanicum]